MEHLVSMLKEVLVERSKRQSLIKSFQQEVWNVKMGEKQSKALEILQELAYDLDYYVQDAELRQEDPTYYGDDRLVEEINSALKQIERCKNGSGS